MKLLTKELEREFEKQGDTSEKELLHIKVIAKFFLPPTRWTWYAFEYDPTTKMFFGCIHGTYTELGYFSLEELKEIKDPVFGVGVERDMYFYGEPAKMQILL